MKKILALLLCAALLLLSGCSGEEAYIPTGGGLAPEEETTAPTQDPSALPGQSLTLMYYPDRSMNPYESTDYTNRALFSLIYQGLFAINGNYEAEPVLCQRYSVSEDGRTWIFYPTTATFSDGSTLTAEDVCASLQAAQNGACYAGRFTHVTSIALTSGGGVCITVNTPYENLPLLLDIPIVKQSQVGDARPVGTGNYEYASTASGLRLHRRSGSTGQGAVYADSITLLEATSNAQIRDQFEFYDVSMVCADPCSGTYADYRCDYELWDCESGVFIYLGCNLYSPVFSNESVRGALTYAIDREALSQDYYRGFGMASTLPVSPKSPWYSETLAARYDYEPSNFTQAVASAGMTGKTVNLLVNSDDTLRLRAARDIAAMLEKCGLKVEIQEQSTNSYRESYKAGLFDLYLGQTRLSPNMDLSPFFAPWGGLSFGGMDDSVIYERCLDALENSGNYLDLCQAVAEDGRLCPILFGNYAVYARRGLLTGLNPARDNVFYVPSERTLEDVQADPVQDETIPTEPEPTETDPSEPGGE